MGNRAEEQLKVTPGEWILGDENDAHAEIELGESGCRINHCREAVYYDPPISRDEMRANIRLCIAAKDLYDVCAEIREAFSYFSEWDLPVGFEDCLNDALKKAGKQ